MLKSYVKIAWRNLLKNGVSSFINIGGLAAGMSVAILIGLWIHDELSFNKSFDNYGRIGKVLTRWKESPRVGTSQPMPLGVELKTYKDDFEQVLLSTGAENHVLSSADKKMKQTGLFIEAEATDVFSIQVIHGSKAGLDDINSIMISSSLSDKFFGDIDPVGKVLMMDNRLPLTITGVYSDFAKNTDLYGVSFLSTWELYISSNDWVERKRNDWNNTWVNIYILLSPVSDFNTASAKIRHVKTPHVSKEEAAAEPNLFIHPMDRWHLYSSFANGGVPVTSVKLQAIWFYSTIGFFVLLLACINFMNLSTARSEKRAREVGIRKAVGSVRGQLILQFFCESILVALCSFIISMGIVFLALPEFNAVAGKDIKLPLLNGWFLLAGISFSLFTGVLAGSYPALYLSSFNPVKVLKGTFKSGRLAALPRQFLVVLQFTVSIAMIIGTVVVYRQVQFAKDRDVGYDQKGLIAIPMTTEEFQGKYDLFRNKLKATGMIEEVAESASSITGIDSGNGGFTWKDKDSSVKDQFGTLSVTHEYGKTVGWKFVNGRDFNAKLPGDSAGFVINEAAVKYMGLKDPVGEVITWERYSGKNFRILGVVKDMIMESPYSPAVPTIFFLSPDDSKNWLFIRIKQGSSIGNALMKIENVFGELTPSVPFDYKFVDTEYSLKFSSEERIGKLAGLFAGLTILISCLGLFGLASFVAEQRSKEIGVRKILGASVINLWMLLSKDYIILVLISSIIAIPMSLYFMRGWLEGYQYRTNLSAGIFVAACACSLLITLLTVSFQAIKTAFNRPAESLRRE